MKAFKTYLEESKKITWIKKPDGYDNSRRMIYKHVTSDGKFEIRLSGMDSMKMNRDGSQKILPTIFDLSKNKPKHPVEASRNVTAAKKKVQDWRDTHGV
jgi:hypothetical protein